MQSDNTVMVHIRKVREKIEDDPRKPKYIKTVWGVGYKIDRQKKRKEGKSEKREDWHV